ncbi:MAG TPA: MlaD family protein [Acidimicrobiales bacterium]|jgi:phospholipid/cholesterol/gamma-HCH transport system substrate-binding protein|nr:MlaD family protein [Acidimicrobiales bacterium]
MKRFGERNLLVVATVGTAVLLILVLLTLNFSHLPFINDDASYQAAFADAAGLAQGDTVSVSGVSEGSITGLRLDGSRVIVSFTVARGVHLGMSTRVAAKVLTPLGQEYLSVAPSGAGALAGSDVIPTSHTAEPSTLISTLSEAGSRVQKINVPQLEKSLNVTNQTLQAVPAAETKAMLSGLAQLSQVIGSRQSELSQLVVNVQQVTKTLANNSSQLVNILGQGDLVVQVLNQRHQAIATLLSSTAALTTQLDAIISAHQAQLGPLVTGLNTISGVLAKDKGDLATAIPLLTAANRYLANVSGSGNFGDFILPAGLIPDNVIAQCAKAGATNPVMGCTP